jgi:hypothetical protein
MDNIVTCPYCGRAAVFMSSKQFYGTDYGTNIYVCRLCDAYVGTHKGSKTPLGTLANQETRNMRKMAHAHFDRLWKSRQMSRTKAYQWMCRAMDLPPEKAHIGMFTADQCRALLKRLEERNYGRTTR